MESLFDFPIVFIIAIIGYIFSLFNKKKKDNQQQHKNIHSKRTPIPAQTFDQMLKKKPIQEKPHSPNTLEAEYAEQKKQAETLTERLQTVPSLPIKHSASLLQKGARSSFSPSQKQLVDGIIWSEIIGPPRALNPHKSMRIKK
ncbi:hypothetical protein [Cytobacillus dafuensis]|uniref:Uncharacterized protein n=1 Tax=Cytobacillus dafuensis TaxID=1742359 RepID=A0A5B8Z6P0_CYTDA|nr:hypothetical protein [Cytobacillus dafuensis]QED48684.1 hypothetical protein FSZ17_16300 [Cytobacillus dafuensis]